MAVDVDIQTVRAFRPSAMTRRPNIARRGARSPDEQAEAERRVAIYAGQVRQRGFITFLPRKPPEIDHGFWTK